MLRMDTPALEKGRIVTLVLSLRVTGAMGASPSLYPPFSRAGDQP